MASLPPTNSRWARSTEPGSAFGGLTKPARGPRGRGGISAPRGGRGGGGRTAPDVKEAVPDTPTAASPAPKPKQPSSRRPSRAGPPPVLTQLAPADVPPSPLSARPAASRRRRSQAGKTTASTPPRINPPAPTDSLARPGRPRLPAAPHTAPVKDTPPHLLPNRPDIRNDIDALVERVRASAMDPRPSTPGSHIDWAGDDDDSLPDLDDWGVNPAVFAASREEEVISPIIVDGLRPLPDLVGQSYHASPLRQHEVVESQVNPLSREVSPPPHAPNEQTGTPRTSKEEATHASKEQPHAEPTLQASKEAQPMRARNPLHPSLPAKPVHVVAVTPLKSTVGAMPMRATPTMKGPKSPEPSSLSEPVQPETNPDEMAEQIPAPAEPVQDKPPAEPAVVEAPAVQVAPPAEPAPSKDPIDHFHVIDGLAASIHAPKPNADPVSAPPHLSSYADLADAPGSRTPLTHTRAHTVGRPAFPRPHHSDYAPRSSRTGHSTPRGGGGGAFQQGNTHSRTHSTPPAGAAYRSPNHARPVLTGAALSRLARTIGNTNVSPTKAQTLATLAD